MEKSKIIKELMPYVLIVVGVLLVKAYIITPVRVSGVSMDTTLRTGDIMILNRFTYYFSSIKRSDIVVVDINDNKLIKRVIAVPGDSIYANENNVYLNDKIIKESYLDEGIVTDDFTLEGVTKKLVVPEGMYFVMGDNRQQSADSRVFGLVPRDKILGKANLTIYPFGRVGMKH